MTKRMVKGRDLRKGDVVIAHGYIKWKMLSEPRYETQRVCELHFKVINAKGKAAKRMIGREYKISMVADNEYELVKRVAR